MNRPTSTAMLGWLVWMGAAYVSMNANAEIAGKELGKPEVGRATFYRTTQIDGVCRNGCVDFGIGRFCSLGRDRRGYRHCAPALANAKIPSNAALPSFPTVSQVHAACCVMERLSHSLKCVGARRAFLPGVRLSSFSSVPK